MTGNRLQLGADSTVSAWVMDRPSRSRVFERLGIDYCCHGEEPLANACRSHRADVQKVLTELRGPSHALMDHDWSHAPLVELVDHIQQTHHAWLKQELPRLAMLIHRSYTIHGLRRRWLADLKETFDRFYVITSRAIDKEQAILFPLARQMPRHELAQPFLPIIFELEIDHKELQTALERMKVETRGFTPPDEACGTFRACLDGLRELQDDTDVHLHEEDDILFTRVLKAELMGENDGT